ncbi:hypothetical protein G7046_g5306 [Stylonectria norvegica]|nr:hypothetical protein G7046_g5306 [Stylonectria norvegica]
MNKSPFSERKPPELAGTDQMQVERLIDPKIALLQELDEWDGTCDFHLHFRLMSGDVEWYLSKLRRWFLWSRDRTSRRERQSKCREVLIAFRDTIRSHMGIWTEDNYGDGDERDTQHYILIVHLRYDFQMEIDSFGNHDIYAEKAFSAYLDNARGKGPTYAAAVGKVQSRFLRRWNWGKFHEEDTEYKCSYCQKICIGEEEKDRHLKSKHVFRHSWSCSALTWYDLGFHDSTIQPGQADTCSFCGKEFLRDDIVPGEQNAKPDWEDLAWHLQYDHLFWGCNRTKKVYQVEVFRQHLERYHWITSGPWIDQLENTCMQKKAWVLEEEALSGRDELGIIWNTDGHHKYYRHQMRRLFPDINDLCVERYESEEERAAALHFME